MLDLHALTAQDLRGLSPEAMAKLAEQMLRHIGEQAKAIKFKDVKIERITFELARLKANRFGAKTERMNAEQRQMFEEALGTKTSVIDLFRYPTITSFARFVSIKGQLGPSPSTAAFFAAAIETKLRTRAHTAVTAREARDAGGARRDRGAHVPRARGRGGSCPP